MDEDEADFDVTDDDVEFEESEEDEEVPPEEPAEPEWSDLENGPLSGQGVCDVDPYAGESRLPYAAVWPVKKPMKIILPDGLGWRVVYPITQGRFTTVTRVVAATRDGLPKVIISYAVNAMSKEKGQVPEPWKDDEVKVLMRLSSRLRASVTTEQLLMFGWNSTLDQLPPAHDTENYFPQYVPTRQKVPTPAFTMTWVRKVNSVRAVPSRIRANPPPLSTGLLWGTREQQLADPYQVAATLFGSDAIPSYKDPNG